MIAETTTATKPKSKSKRTSASKSISVSNRISAADVTTCCICGCTDDRACPGGCSWVNDPAGLMRDICSACAPGVAAKLESTSSTKAAKQHDRIETIPLGQLHRHPLNRAIDPKDPEIVQLAISMSEHGQIEPLRVRMIKSGENPQYQIISGERRFTALVSMGTFAARCTVVETDDATALAEVAVANSHRKDLNPIERAELMQRLMLPTSEGGSGMTRDQAGHVFGLTSESGCKNALRLLQLPQSIKALIISGEIPERIARSLVPYCVAPKIIEAIAKELNDPDDRDEVLLQFVRDGRRWFIDRLVREHTRPISDDVLRNYGWPNGEHPCLFDWKKHENELQIVDLPFNTGFDAKTRREKIEPRQFALNVKLWDKLQAPLVKAAVENAKKKEKQTGKSGASAKAKTLTPKEQAAEDKRKATEAEQRLDTFTTDWKHRLLRSHLSDVTDADLVAASLPWLASCCSSSSGCSLRALSESALVECGLTRPKAKKRNDYWRSSSDQLPMIAAARKGKSFPGDIAERISIRFWQLILWPVSNLMGKPSEDLTPAGELPDRLMYIDHDDVEQLCELAGVSVETAWKAGATDSSDERRLIAVWLMRHTKAQLWKLIDELGVQDVGSHMGREELAGSILSEHRPGKPLRVPKRLTKVSK